MTKISKETKIKAINEYLLHRRKCSLAYVAHRYGMSRTNFRTMVAAYEHHGPAIFTDSPKITADFRIQLVRWMIKNQASYIEIAAHLMPARSQMFGLARSCTA